MSDEKKSALKEVLLTNLLVMAITVIGSLLALQSSIPPAHLIYYLYAIFGTCVIALIIIYLNLTTRQLLSVKREVQVSQALLNALPRFCRMTNRRDTFMVRLDGSVSLYWNFQLETNLDAPLHEVLFPIFADLHNLNIERKSVIIIDTLTVNDEPRNPERCYVARQVREPFYRTSNVNEAPVEFGILRVPVNLPKGWGRCKVQMHIVIRDAFPDVMTKEFVIVDIPSVTDRLEVKIEGPDGYAVRPSESAADTIVATVSTVEFRDPSETHLQNDNWHQEGDSIVWKCNFPKIGYRYLVFFRLEERQKQFAE